MKLFVENLTHVDFSYLDPQRGLLGESWSVNLMLDGSLDQQGMICDFSTVKKRVKQWLDAHLDHCLLVAQGLPRLQVDADEERIDIHWCYADGGRFFCSSPAQAIALLEVERIAPAAVAHWCRARLQALFPDQVKGLTLEFLPERIDGAFYHYSHGLQQHEGNCQRIAHGHRSRIQILRNGQRDSALEAHWAQLLQDSYIGTLAHRVEEGEQHRYVYDARQGHFELSLPGRYCHDLDSETTVERIAGHLAQRIREAFPRDEIEVRAFEGIGKGAIATA